MKLTLLNPSIPKLKKSELCASKILRFKKIGYIFLSIMRESFSIYQIIINHFPQSIPDSLRCILNSCFFVKNWRSRPLHAFFFSTFLRFKNHNSLQHRCHSRLGSCDLEDETRSGREMDESSTWWIVRVADGRCSEEENDYREKMNQKNWKRNGHGKIRYYRLD